MDTEKILNYFKILFPVVSILAILKLDVFYKQFHINVFEYFQITEFLVSFINDIFYYLILGFVVFILFYIPLGIHFVNENSENFEKLKTKNFFQRIWSHIKGNYLTIIFIIFYLWKPTPNSKYIMVLMLSINVVSIFIKEWIIKEYKLNNRNINPLIHNIITFFIMITLLINNQATMEAKKIKNSYENINSFMITTNNDTIKIDSTILYVGKSNEYLFFFDRKLDKPIVYSGSIFKQFTFK